MARDYAVTVQHAPPRSIAAVRVRMPIREVPRRFKDYLDQVYAAAKRGVVELDGQNIFVYRPDGHGDADVEFGVGTRKAFEPTGAVVPSATPAGDVATTTHWGDYALGGAHEAIMTWCRSNGRSLAGPSWEVYGHWSDNPAAVRTDIFYLLKE